MRDHDVLSASLSAVRRLIDSGGQATVTELAEAAGVSRRTWHRYFPAKEDLLRPMMNEASTTLLESLAEPSDTDDVCTSFIAAFDNVAGGLFTERTRGLMPIVVASPSLNAVFDNEGARTAERLRLVLAARLDRNDDDPVVCALSTTLVGLAISALRDSELHGRSPQTLLAERIHALGLPRTILPTATGERRTP